MVKRLFLSIAILLITGQAYAVTLTSILFDDFSMGLPGNPADGFRQADYNGIIGTPGSAIVAIIGGCVIPADCLYWDNDIYFDPAGSDPRTGAIRNNSGSALNYTPLNRSWSTANSGDVVPARVGAYCMVGIDPACPAYQKTFHIYFDETPGFEFQQIDWQGTYTITNGVVTSFSALVGDCQLGDAYCTFNNVPPGYGLNNDPQGVTSCCGGHVSAFGGFKLSYTPNYEPGVHLWTSVNSVDSIYQRVGVYRVEAELVPEVSAFWLLTAGAGLIAGSKRLRRRITR